MDLWQRLEERGREEFGLNKSWYLYAVDLDVSTYGVAEVKFARKAEGKFDYSVKLTNYLKYLDIKEASRI